jgi:hypothetical protein
VSADASVPPGPSGYPSAAGDPAGYDTVSKVVAVLLTVSVPFIALILALVLRASEANPVRREALRAWAIGSGAWLAVGLLIGIIAIASVASSGPHVSHSGPCVGGPAPGATGQPVGHGNYRFDCVGGGSTVVHLGN